MRSTHGRMCSYNTRIYYVILGCSHAKQISTGSFYIICAHWNGVHSNIEFINQFWYYEQCQWPSYIMSYILGSFRLPNWYTNRNAIDTYACSNLLFLLLFYLKKTVYKIIFGNNSWPIYCNYIRSICWLFYGNIFGVTNLYLVHDIITMRNLFSWSILYYYYFIFTLYIKWRKHPRNRYSHYIFLYKQVVYIKI